jgi:hypothetical protein
MTYLASPHFAAGVLHYSYNLTILIHESGNIKPEVQVTNNKFNGFCYNSMISACIAIIMPFTDKSTKMQVN